MAKARRVEQIAEEIQHLLGELIQREIKDPRLGFVTITGVTVTQDLQHARVLASIMGDEAERKESLGVLERARGFLRREVGKAMRLRLTPELHFELDLSLDASDHITQLLRQVAEERRMNPPKLDTEGD